MKRYAFIAFVVVLFIAGFALVALARGFAPAAALFAILACLVGAMWLAAGDGS